MHTSEDLSKKIQELEKKTLDLSSQQNHDMSHYEKDLTKLRLELERGEALHRLLESEMSLARKEAEVQMYSTEEELCNTKAKLLELQGCGRRQMLAVRRRTCSGSGTHLPSESLWVHFGPEAGGSPPLPVPPSPCDESFWGRFGHQLARTPPAHACGRDEYFQPQFVPRGAVAPFGPETDDRVRINVVCQTAHTPPPVPAPDGAFQPCVSTRAASPPAAPSPVPDDRVRVNVVRQTAHTLPPVPAPCDVCLSHVSTPAARASAAPSPAPDDHVRINVVHRTAHTPPPVPAPDDVCLSRVSTPVAGASAAPSPTSDDRVRINVVRRTTHTPPPVPAPCGAVQPHGSPPAASPPAGPAGARNVRWGEPRHRSYTLSESLPSFFLPQATSTPVDRSPPESIPSYFMPQGVSTPVGPVPNVYCGRPADRTYDISPSSVPLVIVLPPSSDMNALYVNPPPVVPAPVPAPNPACWGGPAYSSGSSFGSDYGTDPFATYTISDSSNWSAQATGGPSTFSSCSGYSTWPFSSYWSSGASDSSSFGSRRA